ncbi:SAF domain-containing protein [Clostridium sp. HV4-5-A1G]|nr:SAF domain-containing protein [Clostridium sp. HV4-5-A1G]
MYKYGQVIGRAVKDIKIGEHVHLHNLISIRENI